MGGGDTASVASRGAAIADDVPRPVTLLGVGVEQLLLSRNFEAPKKSSAVVALAQSPGSGSGFGSSRGGSAVPRGGTTGSGSAASSRPVTGKGEASMSHRRVQTQAATPAVIVVPVVDTGPAFVEIGAPQPLSVGAGD